MAKEHSHGGSQITANTDAGKEDKMGTLFPLAQLVAKSGPIRLSELKVAIDMPISLGEVSLWLT